ncbi:MAG: hypothetical protein ACLT0Y_07750 [Christensenellales bacterium]
MEIVLSLENRRGNDTLFRSWFFFFLFIIRHKQRKSILCVFYESSKKPISKFLFPHVAFWSWRVLKVEEENMRQEQSLRTNDGAEDVIRQYATMVYRLALRSGTKGVRTRSFKRCFPLSEKPAGI